MDLHNSDDMKLAATLLPAASTEIVKTVVREAREAHDLWAAASKHEDRLRAKMNDVEVRHGQALSVAKHGRVVIHQPETRWQTAVSSVVTVDPDKDPTILALAAELKAAEQEFQHQLALVKERSISLKAKKGVQTLIERYFEKSVDKKLLAVPAVAVTNRRATAADIERKRVEIAGLRSSLAALRSTSVPKTQLKREARDLVANLVALGAPKISGGEKLNVDFSMHRLTSHVTTVDGNGKEIAGVTSFKTPDALSTMAWLFPDAMIAALERDIDTLDVDDAAALDTDARQAKEAEIKTELLAAEHEEEMLIRAAAASGVEVVRRPDADPRAVLGVVGPEPIR